MRRSPTNLSLSTLLLAVGVLAWGPAAPGAEETFVFKRQEIIRLQPKTGETEPPVVTGVAAQPGGPLMAAVGDDHGVRVWNRTTGELLHRLFGHNDWPHAVAFAADGKTLITCGTDGRVVEWDPVAGRRIKVLLQVDYGLLALDTIPRGRRVAVGGFGPVVHLIDLDTPEQSVNLEAPCGDLRAVAFSTDGTLLAAAGRNGKIRVWDTVHSKHVRDIQSSRRRIHALTFMSDGEVVAAGDDRMIRVFDAATGERVTELSARPAKVMSLAVLGGGRFVSGGSDNRIRMWDVLSDHSVGEMDEHTGSVPTLTVADGNVISGSYDTTIRIWQVEPERRSNQAIRPETTIRQ